MSKGMHRQKLRAMLAALVYTMALAGCAKRHGGNDPSGAPYDLGNRFESRAITFENPDGSKGGGGTAANHLGTGRKGAACKVLPKGETFTLCDIKGSGTIRHLWLTGDFNPHPELLRELVLRAWWDGQEHPSIECPLGDFMGSPHNRIVAYQSAVHSIGQNAALNFWLPMPFRSAAKITLENESNQDCNLYYQIDYSAGDSHPRDVGRMHTLFRRENPTKLREDFEILPMRHGKGRYMGAVLGVRFDDPQWWGEGEVKMYIDGDKDFPTICGTGSEDYICQSYGVQEVASLYHGCTVSRDPYISMYRWHIVDPVVWKKDCRITIQQIGWQKEPDPKFIGGNYFERQDDWSVATFWYEPVPSEPLPPMPSRRDRLAGLRFQLGAEIEKKWNEFGGERGPLGSPTTNELPTPDGIGRFTHFGNASIYWTPQTGAHVVQGDIRKHWAKLGWEKSHLGYPTSDEYDIPGGRRSDFEHGTISWQADSNTVTIP